VRPGSSTAIKSHNRGSHATALLGRVNLGGMTLAVPGATGFVALAQRAVIGIGRVCRPFAVPITEPATE